jgi:NADH dehydrogenase
MSSPRVTVFGGTGLLGRRIVHHLHDADFAVRIAARHPERGRLLFPGYVPDIETVRADANDDASVATAVSGAWAVVNGGEDPLHPSATGPDQLQLRRA